MKGATAANAGRPGAIIKDPGGYKSSPPEVRHVSALIEKGNRYAGSRAASSLTTTSRVFVSSHDFSQPICATNRGHSTLAGSGRFPRHNVTSLAPHGFAADRQPSQVEARVETASGSTDTRRAFGRTEEGIDRYASWLREDGFTGRNERVLIQRIFVSPPPRDQAGNIIGPAPPPTDMGGNEIALWPAMPIQPADPTSRERETAMTD